MPAAATHLNCGQGEFELLRYPSRKQEPLQAWCSADLLLLEIADETATNTLVVNDEHGALCVPLSPAAVWTDSALAAAAITENCERNVQPMPALAWSTEKPGTQFDQVILRIPKVLPYFDYQLASLAAALPAGVQLHCAGMDKHLSPQTATLIEKRLGNVERHRGQRKARVFSAVMPGPSGTISNFSAGYHCQQIDAQLNALPNVFSREKLDIGSRLLLDNLPHLEPAQSAIDLACGNGLLGIAAMQLKRTQHVLFADESAMAIASACANASQILGDSADTAFHLGDGLLGVPKKVELILCNPPFHLGHTVDDFAGRRLLQQAAAALLPGGCLLLVANRHLDYGSSLKHLFRDIDKLAQNDKFIVWRARHS